MEPFLDLVAPIWKPHPGQREFLTNPSRFKVLACGRRWGKTDACAIEILASLHQASPTRHVILAPTQDQANLLIDRVASLLGQLDVPDVQLRRTPYPQLTVGPHRVTARSGHLAKALRGNEATHLVVDEAAFVPESLITEVAMPMLATTNGQMTLISTPNGRNHFWRFYGFGLVGEHGVWSRQAPSAENPHVSLDFLAVQRDLISDRAYATEYEAEFRDSAGQVFRTEMVEACVVVNLPDYDGTAVIGIDFGKTQDATAVAVLKGTREGTSLVELHGFQEPSWVATANRIAGLVEKYPNCRVIADATGAGDAVIEILNRTLGRGVQGLNFTNKNKNDMIDALVSAFDHRRLLMKPHPELLRELQHYEATTSDAGNRKLGAQQGFHDDLVTALALAYQGLRDQPGVRVHCGQPRTFTFTL